ncbi:MAG: transcriptional regulator [Firmicutes bacterium]|nr:transcriptional regulator [Bacillota bacterium]
MKEKVLECMKEAGKPVSAGELVKQFGLDKAEVDTAFKELKKEGLIVSPVRCKWEPANK